MNWWDTIEWQRNRMAQTNCHQWYTENNWWYSTSYVNAGILTIPRVHQHHTDMQNVYMELSFMCCPNTCAVFDCVMAKNRKINWFCIPMPMRKIPLLMIYICVTRKCVTLFNASPYDWIDTWFWLRYFRSVTQ